MSEDAEEMYRPTRSRQSAKADAKAELARIRSTLNNLEVRQDENANHEDEDPNHG